jgi:hypothetical protein
MAALAVPVIATLAACAPAEGPAAGNRLGTMGTGAAVGCVLGGVLGALAGDFGTTFVACAAGAALGAGTGYAVARRNERAALTEQRLRQRADLAEEDARAYAAQAEQVEREIVSLELQTEQLTRAHQRGLLTDTSYKDQMAPVWRRVDVLTRRATAVQAAIWRYEADAAVGRRNGWNTTQIDRATHDLRAANERERFALDELVRALTDGRG